MIPFKLVCLFTTLLITLFANISNPDIQLFTWTGRNITYVYPALNIMFILSFIYYLLKSFDIISTAQLDIIPKPIRFLISYIENSLLFIYASGSIQSYFVPLFWLKDKFKIFPGIDMIITPSIELKKLKLDHLLEKINIPNFKKSLHETQCNDIINNSKDFSALETNMNARIEEYKQVLEMLEKKKNVGPSIWSSIHQWIWDHPLLIGSIITTSIIFYFLYNYNTDILKLMHKEVINDTKSIEKLNNVVTTLKDTTSALSNQSLENIKLTGVLHTALKMHEKTCMSNTDTIKTVIRKISGQIEKINTQNVAFEQKIVTLQNEMDLVKTLSANFNQQIVLVGKAISDNNQTVNEIIRTLAGLGQDDFILIKTILAQSGVDKSNTGELIAFIKSTIATKAK